MPTITESQIYVVPSGVGRIVVWCLSKGGMGASEQENFGGGGGGEGGSIKGVIDVEVGQEYECDVSGEAVFSGPAGMLRGMIGGDSESRFGAPGGGTQYTGPWTIYEAKMGARGEDGKPFNGDVGEGGNGASSPGGYGGAGGTANLPPGVPTALCAGGGGQACSGPPYSPQQGGSPGFPPRIEIAEIPLEWA